MQIIEEFRNNNKNFGFFIHDIAHKIVNNNKRFNSGNWTQAATENMCELHNYT